jgi:hypothetical protein
MIWRGLLEVGAEEEWLVQEMTNQARQFTVVQKAFLVE